MRTNPVYYIAPSAISITPNANGSHRDLAVYIARGTKIKVRCPRAGIGMDDDTSTYQEWTLEGRNRRLADTEGTQEYTVYARLSKSYHNTGYLVFAPKTSGKDKYQYLTLDAGAIHGITSIAGATTSDSDWYVRLGDVSAAENGLRTVTLDTGILGTDQYNEKWAQNPDNLPLRIELGCTIDDEDAGPTPYVYWGQSLVLTATLAEGWSGTDIQRFDHWEITRNSGDSVADNAWNHPAGAGSFHALTDGQIVLSHVRGDDDDFNGAVSSTFTVVAMGIPENPSPGETELVVLESAIINIHAETVEKYELALSANIISYNPQTQTYNPSSIAVRIRATDQRGDVFELTNRHLENAMLAVEYAPVGSDVWVPLTFSGASTDVATASLTSSTAFAGQQSLNVRLVRIVDIDSSDSDSSESSSSSEYEVIELMQQTIAFVRDGEDSKEREWIFRLNSQAGYNSTTGTANGQAVSGQTDGVYNCYLTDDFVPTGWSDDPTGVSQPGDIEYESWRDYDETNHRWGAFRAPVIHNRYAEDGESYRIETNVNNIHILSNSTSATQDIRATLYCKKGAEDENEYSCYWALYARTGSTVRRIYAPSSKRSTLSISGIRVSSDAADADFADALVFVCSNTATDGNAYQSALPSICVAKTEIAVVSDGAQGDDSITYTLAVDPASVNFNTNAVGEFVGPATVAITATAVKHEGQKTPVVDNSGSYQVFVRTETTDTSTGAKTYSAWSGAYNSKAYTLSKNNAIAAATPITAIQFKLAISDSGSAIATATVPVTLGGQRGQEGALGKMFFPMGEWVEQTYERTDDRVPLIHHGTAWNANLQIYGSYYYLNAATATASDEPGVSNKWELCNDFGVVITQGLFAEFAKLGSAIMSGDYIFSMNGRIGSTNYVAGQTYTAGGVTRPAYTWFKGDPSQQTDTFFEPNWWVNLKTGKTYQNDAVINGAITTPFQIQTLPNAGLWSHSWVTVDKYRNFFFNVEGANQQYWLFLPEDSAYNGVQIKLFFHKTSSSEYGNIYQIFVANRTGTPSRIIGMKPVSGSSHSSSVVSGTSIVTGGDDAYMVLTAIPCLTDNRYVSWILENFDEDMFTIQ